MLAGAASLEPFAQESPRLAPPAWIVALAAAMTSVVLVIVVVVIAVSLRRHGPHVSAGAAAAVLDAPAARLGPLPDPPLAAPPPASTAPSTAAPSVAATAAQRFSAAVARRELDVRSIDVRRCRRGRAWGMASAAVTFASSGSVDGVVVGAPFGSTKTAQCISETLGTVHVPPFAGPPVTLRTRVYVAPR
jgi:hypothetical protein